jgi:hypothetical protein
MAKEIQTPKKAAEPVEAAQSTSFDPMAMFQTFASKFSEVTAPGNEPTAGLMEMNQHWMDFVGARFKKDSEFFQSLSNCTSPSDLSTAHTDFYKETVEDYRAEFEKISELGQQAFSKLTGGQAQAGGEAAPV